MSDSIKPSQDAESAENTLDSSVFALKDCCFRGYEFQIEPKGTMTFLGGLETYVARPEFVAPGQEHKALVVFSDIFGHGLVNIKIIADELSRRLSLTVYYPDILEGRHPKASALMPFMQDTSTTPATFSTCSIVSKLRNIASAIPEVPKYAGAVGASKNWPVKSSKFIRELRESKGLTHVGVLGFCLGGAQAILAANEPQLVQAVVIAHPGPVDIEKATTGIKVPTSWIFSEIDDYFPPAKQALVLAALEAKRSSNAPGGDFEVEIYKGTAHGFASRPALFVEEMRLAFEKSLDQEERWFRRWIVEA